MAFPSQWLLVLEKDCIQKLLKRNNPHLQEISMPERKTVQAARRAKAAGKSPSSQAGEFVREQIHKIRRGEHGARSPEQAIAIGLSEARRAGVKMPAPRKGKAPASTRRKARRDVEAGRGAHSSRPSQSRSRATRAALKREPRSTASHKALSEHARKAASARSSAERSASARKGARTRAGVSRRRRGSAGAR